MTATSTKKEPPAKLELLSGTEEPRHEHAEIELLYVAEGTCDVSYRKEQYRLEQEDVLLINTEREHSVSAGGDSLICKLSYPYYEICRELEEDYLLFRCNSITEHGFQYDRLRKQIREVLLEYASNSSNQQYRLHGLCQLLLSYLLDNFKMTSISVENSREWEDDQKLAVIKGYIHEHYREGGSLSALAERLYLSPSSLSRYFKKMTGEAFSKYIRKLRLQKVVEQLVTTDFSVTHIAIEQGYSTPSALNKDFKEYFHKTPKEYRELYQTTVLPRQKKEQGQSQKQRLKTLLNIKEEQEAAEKDYEDIHADISRQEPYKKWVTRIMNVGEAVVLKDAQMQEHVLLLKQRLHIEYIRIWSLFSKNLMIVGEKQGEYNFHQLDSILDFCISHDLKLFLDMGQRTNLAMSSEKKYLYKREEGIEFESEGEWIRLMEQFFRHIWKRYGEDTISGWIVEFTFFLNARPYYMADTFSARRVWELGYRIVKKYIPHGRIAAPGLLAGLDQDLMSQVLDSFFGTDLLPDIFTSYNFPYRPTDEEYHYQKLNNDDFLKRQIQMIREELERHGYQGDYYITDWNNSLANRNYLQDSCYRGTFLLKNILDNYESVGEMGIWYASDLLNFYYDSTRLLSGSGGLVSKDGICKPVFYALLFMSHLGRYRIAQGENYIITKDSDEKLYLLVFHNKSLNYQYYLSDEDVYRPDEVTRLFQNQDSLKLVVELKNLKVDGSYAIREKIVNEEAGNVLNKWKELGFDQDLNYEDIEYLKQISVPEVKIEHVQVEKKRLQLTMVLAPHEIRWIEITKD